MTLARCYTRTRTALSGQMAPCGEFSIDVACRHPHIVIRHGISSHSSQTACAPMLDRRSTDQAKTFRPAIAVTPKSVADGFAYSCLTELAPSAQEVGGYGLLYETGDPGRCTGPSCRILFQRFTLGSDE